MGISPACFFFNQIRRLADLGLPADLRCRGSIFQPASKQKAICAF